MQFTIPDNWENRIKYWQENHTCKYRTKDGWRYVGAIGGADSFIFIPTSIGMALTVRCACGEEILLNDF